jgi:hypothetical protein
MLPIIAMFISHSSIIPNTEWQLDQTLVFMISSQAVKLPVQAMIYIVSPFLQNTEWWLDSSDLSLMLLVLAMFTSCPYSFSKYILAIGFKPTASIIYLC